MIRNLQVLKQPRLTEPPEPPEPALPPRLPRRPRLPRLLRLAPPLGGTLIRSSGAEFGAPVDSVDPCRRTELHVDPTDPMDSTDSMAALARRCHAARTMVASTRDRKDRKDRKAVASGTRTRFGVLQVRPTWRSRDVDIAEITVAISNSVFRVSCGKEKVLLRIYGPTAHGIFRRDDEVRRARYVAGCGFGPQVLLNFDEGRVEEWLEGRAPSHEEIRSDEAIERIARKLRSFHDRTGLNHNDLHHNNMLISGGDLQFLDFEYSGDLDPAYDIANHFNEWMYPYCGPDPHLYQLQLFPSLSQRRSFCAHYLGGSKGKGDLVDDFLQEVERRQQDSHAFWVRWAESSPSEFNTKYGMARKQLLRGAVDLTTSAGRVPPPVEAVEPEKVANGFGGIAKTFNSFLQAPQMGIKPANL